jgi:membrane associated rhomboid family serine protease
VQAAVGSHCLECAKAGRPDMRTRARYFTARQPTLVTYIIMAINVGVFLVITAYEPDTLTRMGGRIGGLPNDGKLGQYDIGLIESVHFGGQVIGGLDAGEWYRMVTAGFLHFGIIHLAFNMLLLFQLGQMLEPVVGRVRFALLYFAALLAGSAGAILLQPNEFHGGASGAVFGLMGAAAIGLRHRGINPFSTGLGTVLLINILLTFTIPGISIGGHIGGVIGGLIVGWFMLAPSWRGLPTWTTYAAPVVVMVLSVAVTWAVVR